MECARQPEFSRTFTKWHTSCLPWSTYSYRSGNRHSSYMIIQPVGCTISTGYRCLRVGIIDYFRYWIIWKSVHERKMLTELSDPILSAHRGVVKLSDPILSAHRGVVKSEIGHQLYYALYFSLWNLLTSFLGLNFQFHRSTSLFPAVTLLVGLLSFVFFSVQ